MTGAFKRSLDGMSDESYAEWRAQCIAESRSSEPAMTPSEFSIDFGALSPKLADQLHAQGIPFDFETITDKCAS